MRSSTHSLLLSYIPQHDLLTYCGRSPADWKGSAQGDWDRDGGTAERRSWEASDPSEWSLSHFQHSAPAGASLPWRSGNSGCTFEQRNRCTDSLATAAPFPGTLVDRFLLRDVEHFAVPSMGGATSSDLCNRTWILRLVYGTARNVISW